jgi:Calcineurin-like phosphoesterase.
MYGKNGINCTMSTYVISDIHGCYNEFLSMLEKIRFSGSDNLILSGDYIDKGKQSYEMRAKPCYTE